MDMRMYGDALVRGCNKNSPKRREGGRRLLVAAGTQPLACFIPPFPDWEPRIPVARSEIAWIRCFAPCDIPPRVKENRLFCDHMQKIAVK